MAIKLGQGFQITSTEVIDTRLLMTKAQMLAANDKTMPAKYFALCSDDNKLYVYDKSNTPNSVTGKFNILEASSKIIRGFYYNDEFYIDSAHTVACTKDENAFYIDKHILGMVYTWSGEAYVPAVPLGSSLQKGENGIDLYGYISASENQIPTKSENGLTWIDQDAALSSSEIHEVIDVE